MRYLFLIFLCASGQATTYELKEGNGRFLMKVDEAGLAYRSEAVSKTFVSKSCNRALLASFYATWLKQLPSEKFPGGQSFIVNGNEFPIDPKGEFVKRLYSLDADFLVLVFSEGKACSK